MKNLLLLIAVLISVMAGAQDKFAYRIFDKNGVQVDYTSMLKNLAEADIVLFGELHNNAIAHWLEYEVSNDLSERRKVILGAEMFEADNQEPLDRYLKGEIDQEAFDTLARLWSNYSTDYAPLVELAKKKELDFVATNIPRSYAGKVHKGGFEALDSLSKDEKKWIAPLPITFDPELPTYKEILVMLGDHATPELVKAQALKDATMAHFILANYKKKHLFIHYNGR
ncbi:MAG: iron-regulated protein, partial [Bacteroidetes bacterium RIFCSPHIGHO2_02_FULL_44_7]